MTAKIEMIKDHSITIQLATEAKKLMLHELRADGEHSAAAYLESSHFQHKWTLVEMNDINFLSPGAAAGGVPCQSNAIERSNLEQKQVREFKRSAIIDFTTQVHRRRRCPQPHASVTSQPISPVQAMEDLQQKSMTDLSLGRKMPRGYVTKDKVDKTVWTKRFFVHARSERNNPIGLDKLMWKWAGYKQGTIIMCSRRMRQVSHCPLRA